MSDISDIRSSIVRKNVLASFLLRGVSIFVSFFLVPITMDYVSPEVYGIWLTLSSVVIWLNFFDVGFTQGLKNKLTEAIANEDWARGQSLVSTTYLLMVLIFMPLCVVLQFIVPLIDWPALLSCNPAYGEDIVKVMHALVFFMCVQMIVNVIVSVVAAFQSVALSTSFNVIGQVLALIIIIVLTKTCPPSLLSLAFSISAMPVLVALIASMILFHSKYRKIRPSLKAIRWELAGDLFSLGYKFFIINIQVIVLYQSTNFLISYVSSPLQVTEYNIAYKYLSLAMMAFTIITAPLWPAYTDAYVRKDFEWMKSTRRKMSKILLVSILSCLLMVLLSKWVYHIWIQDKTIVPIQMTLLVALYVIVYCWMNLNGTLIVGMGTITVETVMVLIGMILHIPLSLLLARFLGAYGVIVSMTFISFAYAVVFNYQVDLILKGKAKGIWLK